MLSQNALLRATIEVTPEGQDNIVRLSHNGETYTESDVKYVFDYVGPTGRRSPNGMIRQVKQSDFTKIIDENIDFKIQKNDSGELILHYIQP
jgi:hypothetical protein